MKLNLLFLMGSAEFLPVNTGGRRDVDAAIGRLFLNGVSTRKLKGIAKELYGQQASAQTVSSTLACLDREVERFKDKAISDTVEFLFLDGISQKVREIGIEKKVMLCVFAVHQERPGEQQRCKICYF
jgi:transposase-like protein